MANGSLATIPDELSLDTPKGEKAQTFAKLLCQLGEPRLAGKLAGFSEKYMQGAFYRDFNNPHSYLRRAVNSFIDSHNKLRTVKADVICDDLLDVSSKIAKHVKTLPVEQAINVLPKISNAMEFARKAGSKAAEDAAQTVQHVNIQIGVGQLYLGDGSKQAKRIDRDDAVDVD